VAGLSAAAEYQRRLGVWSDIRGHLEFLHETASSYPEAVIIELGVAWGNSTSALLSAATLTGGTLWSVDAGEVRDTGMIPADWWDDPHWRFLKADDLSAGAQSWLPEWCDVLFVDSDHGLGHVTGVLAAHMPRVKPGGVALFHDTQFRHPDTDLGEPVGEVAKALDAYCEAHGLTWENRPGFYGMGIVRL
jgi:predicted O-methyltransferase YrrM